jgi:hypothetical protein
MSASTAFERRWTLQSDEWDTTITSNLRGAFLALHFEARAVRRLLIGR